MRRTCYRGLAGATYIKGSSSRLLRKKRLSFRFYNPSYQMWEGLLDSVRTNSFYFKTNHEMVRIMGKRIIELTQTVAVDTCFMV